MTLKELLEKKVLRDNVTVKVFKPDCFGLGEFTKEVTLVRNFGEVTEEKLSKAGLTRDLLDYQVSEVYGSRDRFKLEIILKKS